MWNRQIEPLAGSPSEGRRVLVFDGPGHGKSEVPPPFSMEDQADALTDAMSDLGVEKAIVCGLSWGGMVAMRLALQHPSRVRGLVLLDTNASAEERARAVRFRLFVSLHRRVGMPPWLIEKDVAPRMFCDKTLRERPELVAELTRRANGYPREGVARAAKAVVVHRKSVLDKIHAIKVPTLVLCGREDRGTEPRHSEDIVSRISGSRLEMIDDAGHMTTIEQPERVNAAIVPFVRSLF
jgi:3-oxoadipate enol-lactonase